MMTMRIKSLDNSIESFEMNEMNVNINQIKKFVRMSLEYGRKNLQDASNVFDVFIRVVAMQREVSRLSWRIFESIPTQLMCETIDLDVLKKEIEALHQGDDFLSNIGRSPFWFKSHFCRYMRVIGIGQLQTCRLRLFKRPYFNQNPRECQLCRFWKLSKIKVEYLDVLDE